MSTRRQTPAKVQVRVSPGDDFLGRIHAFEVTGLFCGLDGEGFQKGLAEGVP